MLLLKVGAVCVAGAFLWQLGESGISLLRNPPSLSSAKDSLGEYGPSLAEAARFFDKYEIEFSISRIWLHVKY